MLINSQDPGAVGQKKFLLAKPAGDTENVLENLALGVGLKNGTPHTGEW